MRVPPAVRLLRPRQWIKNLLVFAAPAAAGVLDQGEYLGPTVLLFVAFCLAASGTYCINDAADVEADRTHPRKRERPVAAGEMSPRAAVLQGLGLLVASLGVAAVAGGWATTGIVGLYLALTTSYTLWLKHQAVIDIVAVASGFVVRAVAGIVGTDLPLSDWYLIVAWFGSLFLVASKRTTELNLGASAGEHRKALDAYTESFLLLVRSVSAGITLLAYCLWAFERADLGDGGFPWFQLSILPFTTAILRYALVHSTEEHAGPEDIVLGDRTLLVIGAAWAVTMAFGVYVAGTPPVSG
ncbi:decaprenyl-phosphate phosphoribosyltransferase [Actinospongicola halichondriae]|uniref:decaprenyl-phosphate phosphoribosyltransferase n=1 Tax=Actinospongicola halichondriae TaxID=3236844 RepID=UPI003D4F7CD8